MLYYVSNHPIINRTDSYETIDPSDLSRYLYGLDWVNLDTETTGLNFLEDNLITIQFGTAEDQFVIDVRTGIPSIVKEVIEDRSVCKILANAVFDYRFLLKEGIISENVYDVLIADKILYNGRKQWTKNSPTGFRFRLKDVAKRHLDYDMDKEAQDSFIGMTSHELTEKQIIYAGKDVEFLHHIKRIQEEYLTKAGMMVVAQLEMDNILVNGDLSFTGLKIDGNKWLENEKWVKGLVEPFKKELNEILYSDPLFEDIAYHNEMQLSLFEGVKRQVSVNWNSSQQVKRLFAKIPGLPDEISTSSDFYSTYYRKHKLIETFKNYKEFSSFESKYGTKWLQNYVWADGRVHPEVDPLKETGREAYRNPNLQQIPVNALPEGHEERYRACFVPPKGFLWIGCDYSSQELVIAAVIAKEKAWLEALENEWDIHSMTAAVVFGDDWEKGTQENCNFVKNKQKCKCPKHKSLRATTKTLIYGSIYGASAHRISKVLQVSYEEAEQVLNTFFEGLSGLKSYIEKSQSFGVRKGYIMTMKPFLRRRYFDEWSRGLTDKKIISSIQRKSSNTIIQGTASDMTKRAGILLRDWINKNGFRDSIQIVLKVHDEINIVAREDLAELAAEKLSFFMELTAKEILGVDLLKAEAEIGNHWTK